MPGDTIAEEVVNVKKMNRRVMQSRSVLPLLTGQKTVNHLFLLAPSTPPAILVRA
ncbi:MAG: hypothetical protein HN919_09820 [Verrucomicrobia bacterium]|jgi:hypothetical protein|nr:hypothetical protein [Verrucomicrobiota bacterium]MBT7066588.1 hypothetical protein [Verrucomicrobiota bacterium]MBT7701518.1 hypothetical protein [Verrucomicrobiota bacterium]